MFHEAADKSQRFSLSDEMMGNGGIYLKPNTAVETEAFNGKIFHVKIPIKMSLKVKDAPPDVRGNTAQGGSKIVTLENGTTINVPMFIKEGDVLRINTETGEYVERVQA